ASLFNAAAAHHHLGEEVSAVTLARCVLAAGVEDALRSRTEALLRESEPEVATLIVHGLPPPSAMLRIQLDGHEVVDDGRRPLPIITAPLEGELEVSEGEVLVYRRSVSLRPGGAETLRVVLAPD